jgi:hypothetical protein
LLLCIEDLAVVKILAEQVFVVREISEHSG